MQLLHPETALFHERVAVIAAVGQVLLFKLLPCCSALCGRHIRVCVYDVLIFVHTYAVGDELERIRHV